MNLKHKTGDWLHALTNTQRPHSVLPCVAHVSPSVLLFSFRRLCVVPLQEEKADRTWKGGQSKCTDWGAGSLCWKNRMQNVLFDTADPLPHPALLCCGSLGFMGRDYSRPQKQLLKPPIKSRRLPRLRGEANSRGPQYMQMYRTTEANAQWRTTRP